MARAGLGRNWACAFANDFDPNKASAYRANWGESDLLLGDINVITPKQLPGTPDLVWASFPCQDLSLAGNYLGIGSSSDKCHTRSGTFWPFWRLMQSLMKDGRSPKIIVLENVFGALTSNNGQDFAAIAATFAHSGYRFGAMVIDAAKFLPHSRPRVFVVGVHPDISIPAKLLLSKPNEAWHPQALRQAYTNISQEAKSMWVWWKLAEPPVRSSRFSDLIQDNPEGCSWHTPAETARLLGMMNSLHLGKVEAAKAIAQSEGRLVVGGVYKRTRVDDGDKVQRAEVRFDDLAGCLRTPSGGSSRQSIIVVDQSRRVRSRLLSPREAARLMGLPDTYKLPKSYNEAYHLAGDGVAVPVVRWLAQHIFEPLLSHNLSRLAKKAA